MTTLKVVQSCNTHEPYFTHDLIVSHITAQGGSATIKTHALRQATGMYMHACMHACYIHTYVYTYICTYIHTHVHTYMHDFYIHTYIHTYLHISIHAACILSACICTYNHTYMRTYIFINIHTYILDACTPYQFVQTFRCCRHLSHDPSLSESCRTYDFTLC